MNEMFDVSRLTDAQRLLLRGKGTLKAWNEMGTDFLNLGLVSFDPQAQSLGLKTPFRLTQKGLDVVRRIRETGVPSESLDAPSEKVLEEIIRNDPVRISGPSGPRPFY